MAPKNAAIMSSSPMPHSNKEIQMKRFLQFCGVLLFLFHGLVAHADLRIDKTKKPKAIEATLGKVTANRSGYDTENVITPARGIYPASDGTYFGEDALNGKPAYQWLNATSHLDDGFFGWIFNGKSYLSSIGSYVRYDIKSPDMCYKSLNINANCYLSELHSSVCHLFLFDSKTVDTVAIVQLNIKRDNNELKGLPSCSGVKAMAVAKELPDAMLITLDYYDNASHDSEPASHATTVLLRFSDKNGKLNIRQDDSCLVNPNQYNTITVARNALKQCAARTGKVLTP